MSDNKNVLIEVRDLCKSFDHVKVLNGISTTISQGEVVAIIGPSGCGKSTFLRSMNLLEKPTSGSILFEGTDITDSSVDINKMRQKIGMVFQQFNLFPNHTVKGNIMLAPVQTGLMTKEEASKRADELLVRVGLSDKADVYPAMLSGGQKQRIAIARAIVNEPKVLLLDEPLGALDLKLRQDMQYELIRMKKELGITFIYVTHDQEEALTMSDHIIVMNQGYIQQQGSPEKIYNEPENAFVADFIGDSNIIGATFIQDELVEILGSRFACVDKGFGRNKPVDVVIRPEDVDLLPEGQGSLEGVVTHMIFKGVHYEMEVMAGGFEWLVHSTDMFQVGTKVSIHVDPFDIQIMNKPESEDEEAMGVHE